MNIGGNNYFELNKFFPGIISIHSLALVRENVSRMEFVYDEYRYNPFFHFHSYNTLVNINKVSINAFLK